MYFGGTCFAFQQTCGRLDYVVLVVVACQTDDNLSAAVAVAAVPTMFLLRNEWSLERAGLAEEHA